ncbi:MAG: 3-oxoacyl-ACP synthase III family protein [Myxococcota bacterium]
MKRAHIDHIARFMPEHVVRNEGQAGSEGEFFKAPKERRFAWPEYNAADLGVRALQNLLQQTGLKGSDIDLIICSCSIQDYVNISVVPDIQYRAGATRAQVLNIDTGCASYISMLNTADAFIRAGIHQKIVLVTITNFVSRLKEFQESPKSKVLGDGASATLITAGEQSILASVEESHGENYGLFICRPRSEQGEPQNYWESGTGPLQVEFDPEQVEKIKKNSLGLVVSAINKSIETAGLTKDQIDFLVTHQPNRGLIQLWREGVGIVGPRAFDTFDQFGNLFQNSIPVTLSVLAESGKLQKDSKIALGTFSNGGDFAAGMVLNLGPLA